MDERTEVAVTLAPDVRSPGDRLLDDLLAQSLGGQPSKVAATSLQPGPVRAYDPKATIAKTHYTHKAMIDLLLANPSINQGELAAAFGYTEGWISRVLASDAFNQELEARKAEIVDPVIRASIEERFKALVYRSIDIVMRKLDNPLVGADVALESLGISAKALGYGAKAQGPQVNVNNYVALLPAKAPNTSEWSKTHGRGGADIVQVKTEGG